MFDVIYGSSTSEILLSMVWRLLLAVAIGGVIGIERKAKHKPAGIITNICVCLGATIVAIHQELLVIRSINLLQSYPSLEQAIKVDMGRMTAQVVSGVGFLGAGVIMYNQDKVSGITTATILWVLACIGLLIGSGYIIIALIATALMLFTLVIIRRIEVRIIKMSRKRQHRRKLKKQKQTSPEMPV